MAVKPGDVVTFAATVVTIVYGLAVTACLWVHRRQPVRRDAPTGTEPWVTPIAYEHEDDPSSDGSRW